MIDIEQGLRAASDKLRKILAKRTRGANLSADEEALLSVALGNIPQPGAPAAIPDKASTIKRAASLLTQGGIVVTSQFLRQLKNEGVPGFEERSGRVNLAALVPHLKIRLAAAPSGSAQAPPNKLALECRRLEAQARKVEAEANAVEEISVKKALVITSNRTVSSELKKLLRKLETEMPGEVTGKTLEQNRNYGAALFDELCTKIQAWEAEWPE